MHIIRVKLQPTMEVNIHNQCSDLKIADRKCSSNYENWNKYPDWRVNTGNMMSVEFKSLLAMFEGALICKLQRDDVKSDDQPRPTYTLLFIAWKYEGYKRFLSFLQLIECDKEFHWNKIRPEEYYQRYASQLSTYTGPIRDIWLTDNGTVLMTELDLDFVKRDGVLSITISEGVRGSRIKRPAWIGPER
jgi:hypothetical protein